MYKRQVKHWLQDTIQEANDLIFTQSTRNTEQKGMGTTLVGILKCETTTYIFNVGDSRTYGLYADDFLALTEDHSYIADMLKRGELSEEEAACLLYTSVRIRTRMAVSAVAQDGALRETGSCSPDVYKRQA